MTRVFYRTESLPPIYSVWLTDDELGRAPLYIAGFLTEERRAKYVEGKGWVVVEEPTSGPTPGRDRSPSPRA